MVEEEEKRYQVIYADPPWRYRSDQPPLSRERSDMYGKRRISAAHYYDTMSFEDIAKLPVKEKFADRNCVLFMWVTNPLLDLQLPIIKAWGFEYKTLLTWKKDGSKNVGYWFRGFTEHLALGVRGDIKSFRSLEPNIQSFHVGKHSEKPEGFRRLIESVTRDLNPKIELFARRRVPGWDVWGLEAPAELPTSVTSYFLGGDNNDSRK